MTIEKTLVLGASGQLGHALLRELELAREVLSPNRHELDLTDLESVESYLEQQQPDLILNAAGLTGTKKNEENPQLAMRLNSELPRVLARYVRGRPNASLVHFSCVDVYGKPNQRERYCHEDDQANPLGIYAQTKLQGEQSIVSNCSNYLIFRLCALYHDATKHAQTKPDPIVVGAPTSVSYVASTVVRTLKRIDRRVLKVVPGVYNLCSKGSADWQHFFREVSMQYNNPQLLQQEPSTKVVSLGTSVSVQKAEDNFCLFIPSWQAQLKSSLSK